MVTGYAQEMDPQNGRNKNRLFLSQSLRPKRQKQEGKLTCAVFCGIFVHCPDSKTNKPGKSAYGIDPIWSGKVNKAFDTLS